MVLNDRDNRRPAIPSPPQLFSTNLCTWPWYLSLTVLSVNIYFSFTTTDMWIHYIEGSAFLKNEPKCQIRQIVSTSSSSSTSSLAPAEFVNKRRNIINFDSIIDGDFWGGSKELNDCILRLCNVSFWGYVCDLSFWGPTLHKTSIKMRFQSPFPTLPSMFYWMLSIFSVYDLLKRVESFGRIDFSDQWIGEKLI